MTPSAVARWLLPLLVFALLAALAGCGAPERAPGLWICPMHPEVVADRAGSCPICHMDLVAKEPDETPRVWVCPMHPEVVAHEPGSCPICHMDLVPREGDDEGGEGGAGPPTHAPVRADAEALERAGVATAVAERAAWRPEVRTVGSVAPDERRSYRIEARFAGWIERLPADFTGRRVAAGETLAEIFSPELLAAQQEFLLARQVGARFIASSLPEVRRGGEELVAAARKRLDLYGLPEGFVETLERSGETRRTVPVVAPAAGFLVEKSVFAGQQVAPGQAMFLLVDLSRVWVAASLYERDAARVRIGDRARIALAFEPERAREGRVSWVDPRVDAETRTLSVRFDVANGDGAWRPGMFADVVLAGEPREATIVPDAAVLDTGARRLVFVESVPGRFEPREVEVGDRRDGRAEILAGVEAGERGAARAAFLLDSESRLRAALAARAPKSGTAVAAPHGAAGDERP